VFKYRVKLLVAFLFAVFGVSACFESKPKMFVIAESKSYETSLFRQHCAICHGPEAEGKTLDDGRIVPSLRTGNFKAITAGAIYKQIADGGNGMTPFRNQLTERELQLMAEFVQRDLRGK
jgi:cytochrome c